MGDASPPCSIVHGTDDVPRSARGAALAIGNFDGVHRGHQALLKARATRPRRLGAPAGAILFEPHPREYFQPDEPHFRLTPLPLKLRAAGAASGSISPSCCAFDAALAGAVGGDFIDRVLVEALAARHVVVGYDFRFGKGRGGDPETPAAGGRRARASA